MWPFKSKFDKLEREDVVDAICKLEQESSALEEEIMAYQGKIDALMAKGKTEKSRDMQLFYAKKINNLKDDRAQSIQHAMYLMYNIKLLNKLKRTIDDNQFFAKTSGTALGQLLGDQKALAKFLNQALNTRISAEQVLTNADDTFREIEEAYDQNDQIYGKQSADDELLAMFETEQAVEGEMGLFADNEEDSEETEEEQDSPVENPAE